LDTGLVDVAFRTIVGKARGCASAPSPEDAFDADAAGVSALVEAVQDLYGRMDASLRFQAATEQPVPEPEHAPPSGAQAAKEADFRGVVCPLNYVKTKLLLGQMQGGQVLSVLLDKEGARNVPESAEKDGHTVLSVAPEGESWRVLIQKS